MVAGRARRVKIACRPWQFVLVVVLVVVLDPRGFRHSFDDEDKDEHDCAEEEASANPGGHTRGAVALARWRPVEYTERHWLEDVLTPGWP